MWHCYVICHTSATDPLASPLGRPRARIPSPVASPSEVCRFLLDVTMESRTATIIGVQCLAGAVDDEVHVTKQRRFEGSHARRILKSAPDYCTFQSATWRSSRSSLEKRGMAESLSHLDRIAREAIQRRIRETVLHYDGCL